MKPRNLRHRMEKAAKLLLLVQRHAPEADCRIDEDRGSDGHLIVDFAGSGMSQRKLHKLGIELESKGYRFRQKRRPWLGQVAYHGEADGKPSIVITHAGAQDRMAIAEDKPAEPFSFSESG
jgi:hypothetical protein